MTCFAHIAGVVSRSLHDPYSCTHTRIHPAPGMAPPTRAHSSTLKQGTLALAFGAAKRTSSAPGGKAGPAPTPPTPAPRKRAAPATDDEDDITIVSSDEPDEAITPPPPKRRRTVARKPAATPASTPSPAPHPIRVDGQKVQAVPALAPVPASELPARAKLETGAKRYAAYYASLAEKTGGIPPGMLSLLTFPPDLFSQIYVQ
jgi:hypothetical protein